LGKNQEKPPIMKIEVSNGELLDKLSILQIKMIFIGDPLKLDNIQNELLEIEPLADNLLKKTELKDLFLELKSVNLKLWEIEDSLRNKEKRQEFDEEFIRLARAVYFTNDKRAEIKREINEKSGSFLVEEKSYSDYSG
jgi:hypothetical protein